jgi:hypothetical protein
VTYSPGAVGVETAGRAGRSYARGNVGRVPGQRGPLREQYPPDPGRTPGGARPLPPVDRPGHVGLALCSHRLSDAEEFEHINPSAPDVSPQLHRGGKGHRRGRACRHRERPMRTHITEPSSATDEAHPRPPNPSETVTITSEFLRVSEAKRLYFGGKLSLRWWYRQIELGRLPHFRAGSAVLLRPADVEAFVAAAYQDEPPVPPAAPNEPPPSPPPSTSRLSGGLRFFRN